VKKERQRKERGDREREKINYGRMKERGER
jgi:hypothetical protein